MVKFAVNHENLIVGVAEADIFLNAGAVVSIILITMKKITSFSRF